MAQKYNKIFYLFSKTIARVENQDGELNARVQKFDPYWNVEVNCS